ncbi:MAG TPA: head maturation protease, ClpP-related [Planctomycetota bacterium]|nr:head maturation protease, ClpP-related [Planctomycetota bacterium]
MHNPQLLCQIRASDTKKDEAEILIYDEIGASWFGEGITAKQFVTDLGAIDAKRIRVRINSGGGSAFEGLAIYNALRNHEAKITTEIDGVAASIASVIALAGQTVKMADNAFFMIHNPAGLVMGDANDMREFADLLDKVGGSLAHVYAEKSGQDDDQIQDWMDAETWFTAEEAKAAGFVDTITKGKVIEARADMSAFRNTPTALAALVSSPAPIIPTAAGVHVAEVVTPAPVEPAPVARENPMSDVKDTAAPSGADQLASIRAAELTRINQIRSITKTHNIDAATSDQWVNDGLSVEQVKDNVLGAIQAKAAAAPPVSSTVRARAEKDPRAGFESHCDFLMSVVKDSRAQVRGDVKDERLRMLAVSDDEGHEMAFMLPRAFAPKDIRAAAGSDEQGTYSDTYGGFLVPTQTMPGMLSIRPEADPTAGRTRPVPMTSPIVKFNARTDKNHTTSVSGGLTFTRTPETATATPSRMAMEQVTLEAAPLVGAAYVTEQIMTDSPVSFVAMLAAGFSDERGAHMLNEKLFGIGGSQYVGVVNADCTVSVDKETNQPAKTIVGDNIINMAARVYGLDRSIWLANHDCRPQLAKCSIAIGTAGVLLYQPAQQERFPDMLWGRPIFYTEFCKTVGTAGDLILCNWYEYLEGLYQPMRQDESIHVRFLQLERTFRFYERNCGAPWWRSALTPKNGSTLSPFVTLKVRA